MSHAYTPGLKVSKWSLVKKERKLPIKGVVLVKEGEKVKAETVVARTELPGNVVVMNLAGILGVEPSEVKKFMTKKEGESINKGEIIALNKMLFGILKNPITSPINGFVESISEITGQLILREPPIPIEINAFFDGIVSKVIEGEGIEIETYGTYIQGIFGIGGEKIGKIRIAVNSPDEELKPENIISDEKGNVIVGGSYVRSEAVKKAIESGTSGIITGGIDDKVIKEILGYDIGVAITGNENIPLSIIITEGFGKIAMAKRTFELLKTLEGYKASISGITQIRAGVIRPEIIIPHNFGSDQNHRENEGDLEIGKIVRIIRAPYFGFIGKVVELPTQPIDIETESKTRVLKVEFDGRILTIPRANVELIED